MNTQTNSTVRELRAIDERHVEVRWVAEVAAQDAGDFQLTVDGEDVPLVDWHEPMEWDLGAVYDPGTRTTTLGLARPIDLSSLDAVGLSISERLAQRYGLAPGPIDLPIRYRPFYRRSALTHDGLVVKSSDAVPRPVLDRAADLVDVMLCKRPDIATALYTHHAEIAVYGETETEYSVPEHRLGRRLHTRPAEGFGGVVINPVTSISQVNLTRALDGPYQTRYRNECILAHEFAHAIHLIGIDTLADDGESRRIRALHAAARMRGLWPRTYALSNHEEYFATLTAIWFNAMAESLDGSWDGVRGPINTRAELRDYDPDAYELLAGIYPERSLPAPWDQAPDYFDPTGQRRVNSTSPVSPTASGPTPTTDPTPTAKKES